MELVAGATAGGSRPPSASSKIKTSKPEEGKFLGCGREKSRTRAEGGAHLRQRAAANYRYRNWYCRVTIISSAVMVTGDDKTRQDHCEGELPR